MKHGCLKGLLKGQRSIKVLEAIFGVILNDAGEYRVKEVSIVNEVNDVFMGSHANPS